MELGVQRLILPAVPSVLHTWTTSFGFSKMMPSQRLQFVDYTFLDFQGAIMCQKLLFERPLVESNTSIGISNSLACLVEVFITALSQIHVFIIFFRSPV